MISTFFVVNIPFQAPCGRLFVGAVLRDFNYVPRWRKVDVRKTQGGESGRNRGLDSGLLGNLLSGWWFGT